VPNRWNVPYPKIRSIIHDLHPGSPRVVVPIHFGVKKELRALIGGIHAPHLSITNQERYSLDNRAETTSRQDIPVWFPISEAFRNDDVDTMTESWLPFCRNQESHTVRSFH